jgi:hypothetical protein
MRGIGFLQFIPDILLEIERSIRAIQGGKTWFEQLKDDAGTEPYIYDPMFGPMPNPFLPRDPVEMV